MTKNLTIANARDTLERLTNNELNDSLARLTDAEIRKLSSIVAKPSVRVRVDHRTAPFGLNLITAYGSINLDSNLHDINGVYVNGQRYSTKSQGLDAAAALTGSQDEVLAHLDQRVGRQKRGRRRRRSNNNLDAQTAQTTAFNDLSRSNLTYDSLFDDLGALLTDQQVTVNDIADELSQQKVAEPDLAHFLTHDSKYHNTIIAAITGADLEDQEPDYNFTAVNQQSGFVGKILKQINQPEGQYDAENGVLQVGDRKIYNIPQVDDKGIFHNHGHRYLPYYVGYFANTDDSRIARLRAMDPVQNALDAIALQYKMADGDIRFKTILDVSRNLPDFDQHPYGKEILATLKSKIVLDKAYGKTNSLLAEYSGKSDELGAVALTMLDDDAKGLIDPLGTSNGANMGKVFYLTKGSKVNPDGTLTASGQPYSPVGEFLAQHHVDRDNFNRNQMSFNAFLTSKDVKRLNVCYNEFAMWNSEDAVVLTDHGAKHAFANEKHCGDKIEDLHGNKSTISLIADSEMPDDLAEQKQQVWAKAFAAMNPNLDLIVSPVSVASRLNMGVPHEALAASKHDLYLPDGSVVKDGICEMVYMDLPQTAEHKSVDYELAGDGRRYSTLIRYALASKVGDELYSKAIIDPAARKANVDKLMSSLTRLGVSLKDQNKLVSENNVNLHVDSPAEVSIDDLSLKNPNMIRAYLLDQMQDNQININLGDLVLKSPLTQQKIVDGFGDHVLPIRVEDGKTIPYRYNDLFQALANQNADHLQAAYNKAVACDYRSLTCKDNIMKNIDTMRFHKQAHTDVLIPDPTLKLDSVRSYVDDDEVIIHRDPVIQSGNAISMHNVKDGQPNTVQVNPLIEVMMDADNDGDTLGVVGYSNLHLNDAEKQEFFDRSSMLEQVNQYGRVFLETDKSHFMAAAKACQIDPTQFTFQDHKTNQALVAAVDHANQQIINNPNSYGAYALSFASDQALKDSLGRLADDGIKGDRIEMARIFDHGYTADENKAILKALIAKSEWTGLAGSTTNNLIAGISSRKFDPELTRVSLDLTHTMTQSVLQMKKNADRLGEIDDNIRQMKAVMAGRMTPEQSRQTLKIITNGLLEPQAVDKFVDLVVDRQQYDQKHFGRGVINETPMNTMKMAFESQSANFNKAFVNLAHVEPKVTSKSKRFDLTDLGDDDLQI